MSGLKTFAAAMALLVPAPAGQAATTEATERARLFADCAGRFLAVAEHEAMFDGTAADEAMARRDGFVDLLDAVLPDALGDGLAPSRVRSWRAEARATQRALLAAGEFNMHRDRAAAARDTAAAYVAVCTRLLLGA